jgi:hypothetical protein
MDQNGSGFPYLKQKFFMTSKAMKSGGGTGRVCKTMITNFPENFKAKNYILPVEELSSIYKFMGCKMPLKIVF